MNQLKEHAKREGITHLLTYAEGYHKQVTMKRDRWYGYIKDYDGATLMEFCIDKRVDYLSTKRVADQQRKAIMQEISTLSGLQHANRGASVDIGMGGLPHAVPGLQETSWQPTELQCRMGGELQALDSCLESVCHELEAHDDAWPFRKPVLLADAPDYYEIIKDPVDLSLIRSRLQLQPPYYVSLEMLSADVCRMCENCRRYNGDSNPYWDCAVRLEAFARSRFAEISVVRKPRVMAATCPAG
eukprot:CAMPEP_0181226614 /NCGR_PEP_ID=MMETSP1096-20121128/32352_1 /TAXON_ID=156174 ORGANISM="Chrysochromulina ericina, Strain CCMP281" /NCGR_SAMPLE_ID=MMETSP1096 /ASSEMBLY_ACC=CAM_ASM_000453 /LENGTH=242 /DNA_ID=CAMNT_0023319971 /DNA_START=75 /DNA_END=803 /DNA_ORIENTATION=+